MVDHFLIFLDLLCEICNNNRLVHNLFIKVCICSILMSYFIHCKVKSKETNLLSKMNNNINQCHWLLGGQIIKSFFLLSNFHFFINKGIRDKLFHNFITFKMWNEYRITEIGFIFDIGRTFDILIFFFNNLIWNFKYSFSYLCHFRLWLIVWN